MSRPLLALLKRDAKRAPTNTDAKRASTNTDHTPAILIHIDIYALPHAATTTRTSTKDLLPTNHLGVLFALVAFSAAYKMLRRRDQETAQSRSSNREISVRVVVSAKAWPCLDADLTGKKISEEGIEPSILSVLSSRPNH